MLTFAIDPSRSPSNITGSVTAPLSARIIEAPGTEGLATQGEVRGEAHKLWTWNVGTSKWHVNCLQQLKMIGSWQASKLGLQAGIDVLVWATAHAWVLLALRTQVLVLTRQLDSVLLASLPPAGAHRTVHPPHPAMPQQHLCPACCPG